MGGGLPDFSYIRQAVREAISHLNSFRQQKIRSIAVTGHSLGAIKALDFVKRGIVSSVVSVSEICLFNPHVPRAAIPVPLFGRIPFINLDNYVGTNGLLTYAKQTYGDNFLIFAHLRDIACCPLSDLCYASIVSHVRWDIV